MKITIDTSKIDRSAVDRVRASKLGQAALVLDQLIYNMHTTVPKDKWELPVVQLYAEYTEKLTGVKGDTAKFLTDLRDLLYQRAFEEELK